MLKRFVHLFTTSLKRKTICGNELADEAARMSLVDVSSQEQKDLNVRIVHAGGLVELYHDTICAFEIMEKYPGMHLSRPEIFKQPHESIIHPYEKLLPGQKFYLVPSSTVSKLKRKHMKKPRVGFADKGMEMEETLLKKTVSESGAGAEESFCSAKDFFMSRCAMWKCDREREKPFTPPIKKLRIMKGFGWQPSLTSIEELSP